MPTVLVPLVPGALILTFVGPETSAKPGCTVNVTGALLLLELKLESPAYVAEMLWFPASKLTMPSPIEVFPWLLSGGLLMTCTGGFTCGFVDGTGPKLSVNVTEPVAIPFPEFPATSARTNTRLPNGKGPASGRPLRSEPDKLNVVVLGSAFTVTFIVLELLGAYVLSPL